MGAVEGAGGQVEHVGVGRAGVVVHGHGVDTAQGDPAVEHAADDGQAVGGEAVRGDRQGEPDVEVLRAQLLLHRGDRRHPAFQRGLVGQGRAFDVQVEGLGRVFFHQLAVRVGQARLVAAAHRELFVAEPAEAEHDVAPGLPELVDAAVQFERRRGLVYGVGAAPAGHAPVLRVGDDEAERDVAGRVGRRVLELERRGECDVDVRDGPRLGGRARGVAQVHDLERAGGTEQAQHHDEHAEPQPGEGGGAVVRVPASPDRPAGRWSREPS